MTVRVPKELVDALDSQKNGKSSSLDLDKYMEGKFEEKWLDDDSYAYNFQISVLTDKMAKDITNLIDEQILNEIAEFNGYEKVRYTKIVKDDAIGWPRCAKCRYMMFDARDYKYCPSCGAKINR